MGRLRNIFRSIWNSLLGRAEDKHYGEILDLTYEDLQNKVVEVKRGLASVAQAKHRILQLVQKNRSEADRKEQDALRYLEAGDEPSARAVLEQKAFVDQQLVGLQNDLAQVDGRQAELEATSKQLEIRVQQFLSEKEVMKARHTAASASVEIAETFTGITDDAVNIGRTIGRMQESTEQLEARASGIQELMSSGALDDMFSPGQTALDRGAAELERKASVDATLDRLKKQIGPGAKEKAKT